MEIDIEFGLRLLISFAIGTAIGLEREYRSKAAGLRTMIMICLGATIFTEISIQLGGNTPDRIASTIISGIGFLGAGVIFKDGLSVSGITTATTIWIAAALGMAVGAGEYFIAVVGSAVVLVVLVLFEKVQNVIERINQSRSYKITVEVNHEFEINILQEIKKLQLSVRKKKDYKDGHRSILIYEVVGSEKNLNAFNIHLKEDNRILSYDY
jgi:putative Mg2+ transporter-C (MgtC) family protein